MLHVFHFILPQSLSLSLSLLETIYNNLQLKKCVSLLKKCETPIEQSKESLKA